MARGIHLIPAWIIGRGGNIYPSGLTLSIHPEQGLGQTIHHGGPHQDSEPPPSSQFIATSRCSGTGSRQWSTTTDIFTGPHPGGSTPNPTPFLPFSLPGGCWTRRCSSSENALELTSLIYSNGDTQRLAQSWKGVFCPPTWFLLMRTDSGPAPKPSPTLEPEPLELRPIEHLGISAPQFYALSPSRQKFTALAGLFAYLDSKCLTT